MTTPHAAHTRRRRMNSQKSGKPDAQRRQVMSAAAARIAQEALREDVTVERLAELALADPAFALQLLALVNSPAFSREHKVVDIKQAASLLGIRGVRTVALSLLVSGLCPPAKYCRVLMANALRRAVACRAVARATGYKDLDGAFSTGLFLDSGLLVHAKVDPKQAAALAASPAHYRVLRELSENVPPHPERGAELAEQCALPETTIKAIRRHHDEKCPEGPLPSIAWLAESVAGVFESPEVEHARERAIERGEALALGRDTLLQILEDVPVEVSQVADAMQRDIGEVKDIEGLKADASRLLSEINQQYEGVIRKLGELLSEKERLADELKTANGALAMLATTDALTGLKNRRALEEALIKSGHGAAAHNGWLSIVALDVDHFKKVNDTYGHAAGDAVLARLGALLRQVARPKDIPARYGGEEFNVVLPDTGVDTARRVAESIRQSFEACKTSVEGETVCATVSLGVAVARGEEASDTQSLMNRADKALYAAKRGGRNRVVVAGDSELRDLQAS